MAHADSSRKSSSVPFQPMAGASNLTQDPDHARPGVPTYRVPTATSLQIQSIPNDLMLRQSTFFGNKVVLGFEVEFSPLKV